MKMEKKYIYIWPQNEMLYYLHLDYRYSTCPKSEPLRHNCTLSLAADNADNCS